MCVRGWQTVSEKGQSLSFVGYTVSVATIQSCVTMKVAMDKM